ncbi:MAG: chemotaxis protein CheD [bacterium]
MAGVVTIKTAEIHVGKGAENIVTGSIGSCLVISLYDAVNSVGGMAHSMLPSSKGGHAEEGAPGKYVDQAIDTMIVEILKLGGKQENLVAKFVGGASMFKKLIPEQHSIGTQNIEAAREKLAALGIPIEGEDTGGGTGKIAELNLRNGILDVYTKI